MAAQDAHAANSFRNTAPVDGATSGPLARTLLLLIVVVLDGLGGMTEDLVGVLAGTLSLGDRLVGAALRLKLRCVGGTPGGLLRLTGDLLGLVSDRVSDTHDDLRLPRESLIDAVTPPESARVLPLNHTGTPHPLAVSS